MWFSGFCSLADVRLDEATEAKLIVQALRVNTLSKLTFADSRRFDALVNDVFPGVELRNVEHGKLATALEEVCAEENLTVNQNQVRRI